MAVEAHHLLHNTGGPQKLAPIHAGWEGGGGGGGCYYGTGSDVAVIGRQSQQLMHQQGYHQPASCVGLAAPSSGLLTMMMMTTTTGQYGVQADASESAVTFGGVGAQEAMTAAPCRKRKRAADSSQLLGVAAHLQQQLVDVDRLVLQHTAKMWAELAEQRRRHARQVAAAVEAAAAKRLRAKDEEIERMGRLNWALEERVRGLLVEAQVWRDLAHSNEAAANALRGELQNALDAQNHHAARRAGAGVAANPAAAAMADDAASCCCGENDVAGSGEEAEVGSTAAIRNKCAVCGGGAAEVLLLPCRHLCACAACADVATACPACGCAKNGSVRVNFS
ncbi:hypothetical protein QOZ80_3BG0267350 [Eleusine coracana subsp. coracana]|nr:hypothetical protein QOZ80_3BG0267350 [Eleusine coracana subsp. coracana]